MRESQQTRGRNVEDKDRGMEEWRGEGKCKRKRRGEENNKMMAIIFGENFDKTGKKLDRKTSSLFFFFLQVPNATTLTSLTLTPSSSSWILAAVTTVPFF